MRNLKDIFRTICLRSGSRCASSAHSATHYQLPTTNYHLPSTLNPLPSTHYQLSTKSAFTIVELLVVIAIIAILAGAITMGVNGMFYKSRRGSAMAMRNMLQSGLETYYARTGEWPSAIKSKVNNSGDSDAVQLTATDADQCFREIVKVSTGANANPVIDPSGLIVASGVDDYGCTDIHKNWAEAKKLGVVDDSDHQCNGKNCRRGRDFRDATKKGSKNKIPLASMNFGYVGPNYGRFCRFRVYYYPKSDTVKVFLQKANQYEGIAKYNNGYTDD